MKVCSTCKIRKPIDDFYKRSSSPDGKANDCSDCVKARTKKWRGLPANRKRQIEASKRWRLNNPGRTAQLVRRHKLKIKYGLREETYLAMLEEQKHQCAICKTSGKNLVVDHCHQSGQVRGLLCSNCNAALGFLKDSVEVFIRAAEYLRAARKFPSSVDEGS